MEGGGEVDYPRTYYSKHRVGVEMEGRGGEGWGRDTYFFDHCEGRGTGV